MSVTRRPATTTPPYRARAAPSDAATRRATSGVASPRRARRFQALITARESIACGPPSPVSIDDSRTGIPSANTDAEGSSLVTPKGTTTMRFASTGGPARSAVVAQSPRASAAAPAMAARSTPRRGRDAGRLPGRPLAAVAGVPVRVAADGSGAKASRSATASSSAPAYRSAGSRASAVAMTAARRGGTVGRSTPTGGAAIAARFATIASPDAPPKGGSPASISYSTVPSEYTSDRTSRRPLPVDCSGLMYCGVPRYEPGRVVRGAAESSASAMPKSATSACPSCSRMFSGLMSRWITPARCAASSALATSSAMRTASSTDRCCSRAMRWRSEPPATYGMT